MKIYEFGQPGAPAILLLPGTCCHWKRNFAGVIPLLEPELRVLCVSYDGFDETQDTVFPSMLEETVKLEDFLQVNYGGHIRAAYGCSLGGSFVGLLLQRRNVGIDHGILGSSDLDQASWIGARLQAGLVTPVLHKILRTGALPGWMAKRLENKPAQDRIYLEGMLAMLGVGGGMAFVKRRSVYNQFYSDLVTPLENGLRVPGTTVHCFYAQKMGQKYEARYRQHFDQPDILYQDMQHEELLLLHPQQWAQTVKRLVL